MSQTELSLTKQSQIKDNDTNYQIHTYGCKVNTYDSGLLQKRIQNANIFKDKKNIHILNTCAVTAEATKEAIKKVNKIKKQNPKATVIVTGCAAQVDTDKVNIEGADLVIANSHKGKLEEIVSNYFSGKTSEKVFHSNIFKKEDLELGGGLEEGHTRSFLKIQDGCNSFCTYCVIPFARGKSRSVPIENLVDKVNELYDKGIREVVLTGVHIADYASFKEKKEGIASAHGRRNIERYFFLEDLVESLLLKTKMPRFRLSSLEPGELTDRLVDLYQDTRLCPHFHMSIQSANSKILFAMKRKYDAKSVEKALNTIQSKIPKSFVGMDIICGFPTEAEEDFQDTYDRLNDLDWTRIHVFPYSERPGTKAVLLEDKVMQHKISERSKKLRDLSSVRYRQKAFEQLNTVKDSLLLLKGTKKQALSRDYWTIMLADQPVSGLDLSKLDSTKEYKIKITDFDESNLSRMDGMLRGQILF